jgi:hypothetical protein
LAKWLVSTGPGLSGVALKGPGKAWPLAPPLKEAGWGSGTPIPPRRRRRAGEMPGAVPSGECQESTDLLISNGGEHGHEVYPDRLFTTPTLSRKYRRQGRPTVTHCLRQPLFHISPRSEARAQDPPLKLASAGCAPIKSGIASPFGLTVAKYTTSKCPARPLGLLPLSRES